MTSFLGLIGLACIGGGLMAVAFLLASMPLPVLPKLGRRGLKRRRALEESGYRHVDPLVRLVAIWVEDLPIPSLRKHVGDKLRLAGDYLGLSPNEFISLCLVCGILSIPAGIALASVVPNYAIHVILGFIVLATALPYSKMTEESDRRAKHVHRALPAAVELMSLCMGAGMDFPGSIRQIIDTAPDRSAPLYEELARVLQEVDLGRTRKQALLSFYDRVPTGHVQDFVTAVIQAEEKGNPLSRVLRIQANLQRTRRSSEIEENAGKAAIKLMFPSTLLLVVCLMIVLAPMAMGDGISGAL